MEDKLFSRKHQRGRNFYVKVEKVFEDVDGNRIAPTALMLFISMDYTNHRAVFLCVRPNGISEVIVSLDIEDKYFEVMPNLKSSNGQDRAILALIEFKKLATKHLLVNW